MTNLKNIKIKGFKGLDHIDLETQSINIITGRNNTGKTSILEAINLINNPGSLKNFEGNFQKTINRLHTECTIKGTINGTRRDVILRPTKENEIFQYFLEAYSKIIKQSLRRPFLFSEKGKELMDNEKSINGFVEKVKTELEKILDIEKVKRAINDFMVMVINGDKFPYFYRTHNSQEVINNHLELLFNRLKETDLVKNYFEDEQSLKFILEDMSSMRTRGFFIKNPPSKGDLTFIKSAEISIRNKDKEKNAVKIDNIEDYLKKKNLVKHLKDFNLDSIVFRDENGKYSVPFEFMGGGFKSIVGFLWMLGEEKNNEIVLVEEPENHLHPGYIQEIVSFLIKLTREDRLQLFITTHDIDFINEFLNNDLQAKEKDFLKKTLKFFS